MFVKLNDQHHKESTGHHFYYLHTWCPKKKYIQNVKKKKKKIHVKMLWGFKNPKKALFQVLKI